MYPLTVIIYQLASFILIIARQFSERQVVRLLKKNKTFFECIVLTLTWSHHPTTLNPAYNSKCRGLYIVWFGFCLQTDTFGSRKSISVIWMSWMLRSETVSKCSLCSTHSMYLHCTVSLCYYWMHTQSNKQIRLADGFMNSCREMEKLPYCKTSHHYHVRISIASPYRLENDADRCWSLRARACGYPVRACTRARSRMCMYACVCVCVCANEWVSE